MVVDLPILNFLKGNTSNRALRLIMECRPLLWTKGFIKKLTHQRGVASPLGITNHRKKALVRGFDFIFSAKLKILKFFNDCCHLFNTIFPSMALCQ